MCVPLPGNRIRVHRAEFLHVWLPLSTALPMDALAVLQISMSLQAAFSTTSACSTMAVGRKEREQAYLQFVECLKALAYAQITHREDVQAAAMEHRKHVHGPAPCIRLSYQCLCT